MDPRQTNDPGSAGASRLEALWEGDFGNAYVDRNLRAGDPRGPFWTGLLAGLPVRSVLEVGCNVGANLQWLVELLPPAGVYGIDINHEALRRLRRGYPDVNAVWGRARRLPFRDRWFDLVFTMGVLIHQSESELPEVMAEMVRCSGAYVLCGEYFSEEVVEVPYRGQQGALFKRDYGRLFLESFPELRLVDRGFLGRDAGWDDVTYWLFRRDSGDA